MVERGEPRGQPTDLAQAVGEYLRKNGPSRTTGTGATPSPQREVAGIHYPDGRVLYRELGILCAVGESLEEGQARKRRQWVADLFYRATIPVAFTEWDFESFPSGDGEKRGAYGAAQSYAEEISRENLLLVGATGTGKTGLAVCVLKARLEQGVPSVFVSVPDLLDRIRATYSPKSEHDYTELMETVKTVDFLVLDDLGAHYATEWAREKLFQLLGYRHDWLLPTVVTSDRPLGELEACVGRRTLARIVENGQVVQVGGRDLRRRV